MTLKINPIVATLLIAGIIILIVALFRGCSQSKKESVAKEKALVLADSALAVMKEYKAKNDSSAKLFQDTIEFERGQNALANEQKLRTEDELRDVLKENKALIKKYKQGDYTDTSSITVPSEFVTDCQGCFIKLEKTTGLVEKYEKDINNIQASWDRQTKIYQNRFKELDAEKLGFYNKINSLEKQQKKAAYKLEPHGRLYLSWGVLWRPLPIGAGGGFMYQNKRDLIWGLKGYYGKGGTTVETTINFPLSLKFK